MLAFAANAVAAVAIAAAFTSFRPAADVLAQETWGYGKPSSTWITAFATGQRWWIRYRPEALVQSEPAGYQPVVRVPREDVHATRRLVRPMRSIGYYAVAGAVVWARSLGSPDLVYDWGLLVQFQQALLIAAIASIPLFLLPSVSPGRRLAFFVLYNVCSAVVLHLRPNDERFVVDGIIDSAMAAPAALLAAGAFATLLRRIGRPGRVNVAIAGLASLFLGLCPLVRGELFPAIAFAYAFAAFVFAIAERRRLPWLAACLALTLVPMIAYGAINRSVFGRFVPLRMQDGQNMLEPIGQYPNPYGIVWDDEWFERFAAERGVAYGSFEADDLARATYVELLGQNPSLFVRNFFLRLERFSSYFDLPIGVSSIVLTLVALAFACARDTRRLPLVMSAVLAIGFLLFFAWTNSDRRPVIPIHYLLNAAIAIGAASICLAVAEGSVPRRLQSLWRGMEQSTVQNVPNSDATR